VDEQEVGVEGEDDSSVEAEHHVGVDIDEVGVVVRGVVEGDREGEGVEASVVPDLERLEGEMDVGDCPSEGMRGGVESLF
jgi:hypothetical protein